MRSNPTPYASDAVSCSEVPAQYWIDQLNLTRHPEGGYFRETYRAKEMISPNALPHGFSGPRSVATAIYYLLEAGDFSAFHRIRSDETWHFYAGGPLDVHILSAGQHRCVTIGSQLHLGHHLQWTVPAGTWFASRPALGTRYSLVGCTVSPGFDFADFELAVASHLSAEFPAYAPLIQELTRG